MCGPRWHDAKMPLLLVKCLAIIPHLSTFLANLRPPSLRTSRSVLRTGKRLLAVALAPGSGGSLLCVCAQFAPQAAEIVARVLLEHLATDPRRQRARVTLIERHAQGWPARCWWLLPGCTCRTDKPPLPILSCNRLSELPPRRGRRRRRPIRHRRHPKCRSRRRPMCCRPLRQRCQPPGLYRYCLARYRNKSRKMWRDRSSHQSRRRSPRCQARTSARSCRPVASWPVVFRRAVRRSRSIAAVCRYRYRRRSSKWLRRRLARPTEHLSISSLAVLDRATCLLQDLA